MATSQLPPGAIPYGASPTTQEPKGNLPPGAIPYRIPTNQGLGLTNALQPVDSLENNSAYQVAKWFPDTISSIEDQAVNAVATPVQTVGELMTLATKDPSYASTSNKVLNGVTDVEGRPINITPMNNAQDVSEKAGDIASTALLALAPETSSILKWGLLGAGQGAAQSMATGNPIVSKSTLENAGIGLVFGGTLGMLGNVARSVGNVEKSSTGIDSQLTNDLKHLQTKDLKSGLETAQASNDSNFNPTSADWLSNYISERTQQLKNVVAVAGKAIGVAKKAAENIPIMSVDKTGNVTTGATVVDGVKDEINTLIQDYTSHQFSSYASGEPSELSIENYPQGPSTEGLSSEEEPSVVPLPNHQAAELAPQETRTLNWLSRKLQILKENPTVANASDIMHQLDIDWSAKDKYVPQTDRLNNILSRTYGILNDIIRPAAPELAAANDAFRPLKDAQKVLTDNAGQELQNMDLLLRRVQYGGKSATSQSVLDTLDSAIGLSKDETPSKVLAVTARWLRDTYEKGISRNSGGAQALQQEKDLTALVAGYTKSAMQGALNIGRKMMLPNPAEYALSITRGEKFSFMPFVHNIDKFLDSPSANPLITATQNSFKKLGISSNKVGQTTLGFLKALMIHNLAKSYVNQPQQNSFSPPVQTAPVPTLSQPQSSATAPNTMAAATTNLTPATTGQGMSAQMRKGGLATMPNGMNLSDSSMSLS